MENFFNRNPYYFDESFEMVYFIKEFGILTWFKEFDLSKDVCNNDFDEFERNGNLSVPYEIENYYPKKTILKSENKLSQLNTASVRNVITKKSKKKIKKEPEYCVFCANNKMPESAFRSHRVRDSNGIVSCPRLRAYVCPNCYQSGDNAHTLKYCPKKPIITMKQTELMEAKYKMKKNKFNN